MILELLLEQMVRINWLPYIAIVSLSQRKTIHVNISFNCLPWQQEENLLDVLQLVLSVMTEQPDTCIPVFDKVDGLR